MTTRIATWVTAVCLVLLGALAFAQDVSPEKRERSIDKAAEKLFKRRPGGEPSCAQARR